MAADLRFLRSGCRLVHTFRSRLYEYQMKLAYLSHEIQTGMVVI